MIRYVLIPLALILLLIVVAALVVPRLIDVDKLVALAASELHKQTGATLTIEGDTHLSLFPVVGVSLTDAAITLPQAQQPDLRVHSLDVGMKLLPLLSRKVEIDTIKLDGVTLRIDAAQLPKGKAVHADDVAASAGTALAVPAALNVQQLLITNSRLEWVDAASTTVVELTKLQATNLNLVQQPISLELQLRRPGERALDLSVNSTLRVNQQAQQIQLDDVTAKLSGATPDTVTLHASGSIDLTQEAGNIDVTLNQGETQGTGKLRYDNKASPRLDATVHFNKFDPALLALAGPQALTAADKTTSPDTADQPLPLEAMRLIDTHAIVDIDSAHFDVHPVNNLHLELRGTGGVIDITALRGELHGGALDATAKVDASGDTAALTTRGSLTHFDIARVLAATSSKPVLAGNATVDWQLHGSGRTRDALTTSLTGPVKLTTENVVLQRTSVEQLMCQAVALTNQESLTANFGPDTHFKSLTADIQLGNGAATVNPLRAALPGIALDGNGRYDLLKKDFVASLKARLSPELEQVDHACRISKRLVAIDWPVDCAGSVTMEPGKWCKVDAAKILQDLAGNEGLEKLQKKAGKLLDKLFNRKD